MQLTYPRLRARHTRLSTRLLAGSLLGLVAFVSLWSTSASLAAPDEEVSSIDLIELTRQIDPASRDFLVRQLSDSARRGSALVVTLDVQGSVGISGDGLVQLVSAAPTPVIAWVPSASMVAGAGLDIAKAADLFVVGKGASVGSMTGEQAVEKGIADIEAASTLEMLEHLRGREVALPGGSAKFASSPFAVAFRKPSVIQSLLHSTTIPEVAYLLLIVGVFGLVFEMYNPGIGGAALAGASALGFGFYGIWVLPVSWFAVALIFVALGLFVIDLHTSGLGWLTGSGAVAFVAGSWMLVPAEGIGRISMWAIALGLAMCLAFFFQAMTAAVRARTARPLAGSENIVGSKGLARTDISPDGQVLAGGTLWRARTLGAAIPQGANVSIKGVSGLMLVVEVDEDEAH